MLSSVYKWRLFFIASHPVFAVNNKQYNCPLYIEKEKVTAETRNQNKLPSVQRRNKQNNSPVGYTGCVSEVG